MTRKQRNKEYIRVYEKFLSGIAVFVCVELWPKMGPMEDERFINATKEFHLFKPDSEEGLWGWWDEEDKDSRLNALAFCIAMTE